MNPDTLPPIITKIRPEHNILELIFDEPPDPGSAIHPDNYTLRNSGGHDSQPWKVQNNAKNILALTFDLDFVNGTYKLNCNKLTDVNGNTSFDYTIRFDNAMTTDLLPFQVLISEIMADPSPVVGLPPEEYIEIFNPTDQLLDLADLHLQFESNTYAMDTSVLWLNPGAYLILCDKNASETFKSFGKVHRMNRWPAIRNTYGTIALVHHSKIIHSVTYSDTWYGSTQKKNGGWSMEMINTRNVCDRERNWGASEAAWGGTPGQPNSIADPRLELDWIIDSCIVKDDYTIALHINKHLGQIEKDSIKIVPRLDIQSVKVFPESGSIELMLDSPLQSGKLYGLSCKAKSCTGEYISTPLLISFIKKEGSRFQDLIINEILFNPVPGGYDYVEIYNKSVKVISTEGWTWSNENNGQKRKITSAQWILPGEYVVFTADPDYMVNQYKNVNHGWIIRQTLPSLPDESGQLSLFASSGLLVDSIVYHENFHSPILNSKEGVALERINGVYPPQWHSASGIERYGTPTRPNSAGNPVLQPEYFRLPQKIFSPDADGLEDYLKLKYSLPARDYLSRIYIYNDQGRLIKRLVDNLILSFQGELEWDGKDENNQNCPAGIYIVDIEALALDGTRIKTRLASVLALK